MPQVTGTNNVTFSFFQNLLYGIGQSQKIPIPLTFRSIFSTYGALLDQCDLIHCKEYTFVASTPQTIDLQSLLDIFGVTADFARVKLFAIRVNSQVDGQVLLLGANGANDWLGLNSGAASATTPVYPGSPLNDGFTIFQAPNTTAMVVNTGAHLIKMNPGANAYTVDLLIAGNAE